MGNIIVTCG